MTRYLDLAEFRAQARQGRAPDGAEVRLNAPATEVCAVSARDRTIRFRITTGRPDRMRDIIDPKGWQLEAYRLNPVVLWAHQYGTGPGGGLGLPIAKALSIEADARGLVSVAQFATKDEYAFADTVYQLLKGGYLNAVSVGFKPLKHVYNAERDGVDFIEQELLEYSVVPIPANPAALVEEGVDLAPLAAWVHRAQGAAWRHTAMRSASDLVLSPADPDDARPVIELIDESEDDLILELDDRDEPALDLAKLQANRDAIRRWRGRGTR